METSMLDFFDYNITSPTGYQFLVRILKIARMAPKSKCAFRASYFAERCLQEHDMLVYRPSLVAAAAAYLALKQERPEPWVSACLPPHLPASLLLSPRLPPKALRVTPAYCFHGRASHSHSASPTHAQSAELQQFTGYSQDQLLPAARAITQYVSKNPMAPSRRPLQAVQKKFEHLKYLAVSEDIPPTL